MEANSTFTPILLPDDAQLRTRLAWWITQIGSPPVLGLAGILLVGFALGTGQIWSLLLYASLALLLPFGFVL
ncbi:MAG: hypothetical protein KC413_25115, partial [Anaerolineales bacterium]|nr:hypothetical protein [Anaerolineales bacterium]